jgi:hypothetical protein
LEQGTYGISGPSEDGDLDGDGYDDLAAGAQELPNPSTYGGFGRRVW